MLERTHIATITGAHGLKGEVVVKGLTEKPENFIAYAALSNEGGLPYACTITGRKKDRLIVRVDGIHDRNSSEALKGTKLYIPTDALPSSDEMGFAIHEMVGLAVFNDKQKEVGTVKALENFGAGDILLIRFHNDTEEYFPFNDAYFSRVDIDARTVIFHPPAYI